MNAETALHARLLASSAVTALVGERIYELRVPYTAPMPAITYQKIDAGYFSTLTRSLSIARPRIQVNCWADTPDVAREVAQAVRASLDGYDANGVSAMILDAHVLPVSPDISRAGIAQDYAIWETE